MFANPKKWSLIISVAMLLYTPSALAYPDPIAFIKDYEEVAGYIEEISRANGESFEKDALLYPGDQVRLKEGGNGIVSIECGPYARLDDVDSRTYKISQMPPSMFSEISQTIYDCFSFFWGGVDNILSKTSRNTEDVKTGVTRGQEIEADLRPQPGFDVTLLMHQQVRFAWNLEEKGVQGTFSIQERNGKILYEKKVDNHDSLTILPEAIGVKPGRRYIWTVDGGNNLYEFSVLDHQTETQIMEALTKIDNEPITQNEIMLKKTKYVQLISDTFPEAVDLYWLSAQWLMGINKPPKNIDDEKWMLLKKCIRHLNKDMGET